jgi:hypothetical protein
MAFFEQDSLLRELCAQSSSSSQGHRAKLQSGKTSPPDELRLQLARSTIESVEQSLDSSPSVFRSGHPIDLPGRCTKSYDPKGGPATKQTSGVQTGVRKGDRDTRVKRQHNIYFRLGLQGRLTRFLHLVGCDFISTGHSSFGLRLVVAFRGAESGSRVDRTVSGNKL